ncbi:MAG: DUF6577 family protein [Kiritimatiellia bacterium]
MTDRTDIRLSIANALAAFARCPLPEAAAGLFDTLGYRSTRTLARQSGKPADFLGQFSVPESDAWKKMAQVHWWKSVHLLFQFTAAEIDIAFKGPELFATTGVDRKDMSSFLFLAVELSPPPEKNVTRTDLAGITRALNRLFSMPVIVLFKCGDTVTLAAIQRRLNQCDQSRDVLEKVSLVREITVAEPHSAHVRILADLAIDALLVKSESRSFANLHAAWGRALDSTELNNRFFRELADWYFWAVKHTTFPADAGPNRDIRNATSVIRLLTRLIFCWFIKEKGLLPADLFLSRKVARLLSSDFAPDGRATIYYKAILQNLFFATLNQEMGADAQGKPLRRFRTSASAGRDPHFMVHTLYRYRDLISDPAAALEILRDIPFLNGGLFECLDRTEDLPDGKQRHIRIDGFSDRDDNALAVPDFLFFGEPTRVNLSDAYGDARFADVKVRGLLDIFDSYKFTVTENTPIEEDVALDPELLGRVFENLLAAYNPETSNTARKQTGSFYTPRNIVDYMVEQALFHALRTRYAERAKPAADFDTRLASLLAYTAEPPVFSKAECATLIDVLDSLKILDPACGSGAFPMGVLHRLVHVLGRLDPRNALWKEKQLARVDRLMELASGFEDPTLRESNLHDLEEQRAGIEEAFERNDLDYGRKLYLIENCIFGVDIQPIAVQIAKLRCFISLVVNQRPDPAAKNLGIRPLPNLETKFVAANTLLGVAKPEGWLPDQGIAKLEKELRDVRHRHFSAKRPSDKTACRAKDRELRRRIADELQGPRLDGKAYRLATTVFKTLAKIKRQNWQVADADADVGSVLHDARETLRTLAGLELSAPARQRVTALAAALDETFGKVQATGNQPAALLLLVNQLTGPDGPVGRASNDLLHGTGFPADTARMLAAWDPYDQNKASPFFDPEWMFGVPIGRVAVGATPATLRGSFAFVNETAGQMEILDRAPVTMESGFDITLGNPPFVRADEPSDWNREQRAKILESGDYETLWEKWDLFVPFMERAIKLLRPGGVSTLIVSDAFCHAKYAQKPQNWLLQSTRILRLDFCGEIKIFDAAVHNVIYAVQKASGTANRPDRHLHIEEFGNITELATDEQRNLTYRAFFPKEVETEMCSRGRMVQLADVCYISKGMVVHADERQAQGVFRMEDVVVDVKDAKHPRRFAEGKHLDKWLPASNKWLEWGTKRAPSLFSRPTFPELHEATEKILVQRSPGPDPKCCYDDEQIHFTESSVGFIPWQHLAGVRNRSISKSALYSDEITARESVPKREELEATSKQFAVKYLLAVMNSSTARDFLRANRRSNIHLYPDDWKNLPIPDVDAKIQAPLVKLVDRILTLRRADPAADIAELERQVDALVAEAYGVKPGKQSPPTELKEVLRTQCLPTLGKKNLYLHLDAIRDWLDQESVPWETTTLHLYMSELTAAGFVHDAGKGWYSTLANPFALEVQPVRELQQVLTAKFPLLSFGVWSTAQVRHFAQHMLNKFAFFVYVMPDAVRPVCDHLLDAGWNAIPGSREKRAGEALMLREKTVVVRPMGAAEWMPESHALGIEPMLVCIHRECARLGLMDAGECQTIARRAVESGRIDMGALQALAGDQKMVLGEVLGFEYNIAEN